VIYLAVEQAGIDIVMLNLQAIAELGAKGDKETLCKHRRAGRTVYQVIATLNPGVLALVDLSNPISQETLNSLLHHTELSSKGALYQGYIQEVFVYLVEFLKETRETLYKLFNISLEKVSTKLSITEY
jgi:hypothetical protein